VVSYCPPTLVQQARWLQANLSRVRLGLDKLSVTAIIGQPARAESFLLADGSMIEVMFYHTASTICRRPDVDASLLPMVFQNNRLLGYGQDYYHQFIMPQLRQPLAQSAPPRATGDLPPAANAPPRTMTEDLPGSHPRTARPASHSVMAPSDITVPTSPTPGIRDEQIGKGEPLPQ
jgi:hypothetical protein